MGTSYSPIPMSIVMQSDQGPTLLEARGLTPSAELGDGRFPTPAEIRRTLDEMSDCQWSESLSSRDLEITVAKQDESAFAHIWVEDYALSRKDNEPRQFSFYRGHIELVVEIIKRLSHFCGPFLLTDGIGFAVIEPGTTVDENIEFS